MSLTKLKKFFYTANVFCTFFSGVQNNSCPWQTTTPLIWSFLCGSNWGRITGVPLYYILLHWSQNQSKNFQTIKTSCKWWTFPQTIKDCVQSFPDIGEETNQSDTMEGQWKRHQLTAVQDHNVRYQPWMDPYLWHWCSPLGLPLYLSGKQTIPERKCWVWYWWTQGKWSCPDTHPNK